MTAFWVSFLIPYFDLLERGNHDQLLQLEDGVYKDMWFTQELSEPVMGIDGEEDKKEETGS